MSQPQSTIPLTLKQRTFVVALFLLALVLSYFVVFSIDVPAANVRNSFQTLRHSGAEAGATMP